MKKPLLISLTATLFVATLMSGGWAQAQNRVYRCGNEYTNTVAPGQKGCKPVEGGNVIVVPRFAEPTKVAKAAGPSNNGDTAARRQGLESELRLAEARRAELLAEYNNGEPEKMGPEFRNHQQYLDRVDALRANIERSESEIAGLRRELSFQPASK